MKKPVIFSAVCLMFALLSFAYSENYWEMRDKTNTLRAYITTGGVLSGVTIDGAAVNTGTLPNARLDASSVTLRGSTFNVADRLLLLDGTGKIPALDGSLLTGVTASAVTVKTAVQLQALTCASGTCVYFNSDDWDLYTATGTGVSQFRNTRTGVGP